MGNFFEDNEDLQFYVDRGIHWEPMVRVTEYDFKAEEGFTETKEAVEFYRDILNLVGEFSADQVAPRAQEIDRQKLKVEQGELHFPPVLQEVFDSLKGLELHGMCLPRELGGMNVPLIVYMMNAELIGRADASVMAHHSFHGGIAMAMLFYSILEGTTEFQTDPPRINHTRFQEFIQEIMRGEAFGSMDITESDAGSDMAQLRTKGEQDSDGNWHVTGQKIFITSGHGKYHIVIARTEKTDDSDAFAGLNGLSLFVVPAYSEENGQRVWYASVDGAEDKLGHTGSATVSISYDRTPAHLVGKRGEGFKYMLLLMNYARIGVGFEALGVCEAAYRAAKNYASQRPSMGKMIAQHEMIADYLDEMKTDIQAIRAMAMASAYTEEMSNRLNIQLNVMALSEEAAAKIRRQRRRFQKRTRALTPLLKYFAAEKAVEITRRAIQIHGGVGYTKEYPVEKLLRDAIVFPIYEGTSQIQALMVMKDTLMGTLKAPQAFARRTAAAAARTITARNPMERRVARIQSQCYAAIRHLMSRVAVDKFKAVRTRPMHQWSKAFLKDWNPKQDFALAMLHAERLTRMLVDKAAAEILLEQMLEFPEREELLVRFLERAEPRVQYLHHVITSTGDRMLETLKEKGAEPVQDEKVAS